MYTPGESCPGLPHFFRRASHDPYFLYAASNAGSLLALIAYPFIIEPRIGVAAQTRLWSAGYVVLFILLILTVVALITRNSPPKLGGEASRAERAKTAWFRKGTT